LKVLYGMHWIMFHDLPDFVSTPPQRGRYNTNQETLMFQTLTTIELL
jgi:hypothetical protein